ncbi:MAG: L,D-transpeptidase family protein [Pseudomonadota bacterium]
MRTRKHTTTNESRRRWNAHGFMLPALALVVQLCSVGWTKEPLYPAPILNCMVEGTFHTLIVDKSRQQITVWKVKDGEPALVESIKCSTGENSGDKWIRGDMRTPEGVYFFCSVIDGRTLPSKYGLWAFTTDYPNFVDRRKGKNGDGIWLHGRDKPLGPKPDSNGCIALENEDLIRVSKYVRLQSTPLVVVRQLEMVERSRIIAKDRGLRDIIESWRRSWEGQDLDRYMDHYSKNFQGCWLDYDSWKDKKRRLIERYSKIKVKLGHVYLYQQDGMVTAIFTQSYSSDMYQATGIKVLYLVDEGQPRIYAEDFHRLVDDPFPIAPLLARVGVEVPMGGEDTPEFKIRLVSTDEMEPSQKEEIERPRPSAPGKAVVAGKIPDTDRYSSAANLMLFSAAKERFVTADSVAPALASDEMPAWEGSVELGRRKVTGAERSVILEEPVRRAEVETVPVEGEFDQSGSKETLASPEAKEDSEAGAAGGRAETKVEESGNKTAGKESNLDSDSDNRDNIIEFLGKWKSSWEKKDLDTFLKMYHQNFKTGNLNYDKFKEAKTSFFQKYKNIKVQVDQLEVKKSGKALSVKFLQRFQGDDYRDKGWKSMVLVGRKDKGYRIIAERWSPF